MKTKNYFFINLMAVGFLLLMIFSCSKSNKSNDQKSNPTKDDHQSTQTDPVYHINLPGEKCDELCKASYIADSVIYVPLETNPKALLGDIRILAMNDSYIVISDKKRIMAFQSNGKFIGQIGKTGKGPGELSLISNFLLKDDTLFITSSGKFGITKYTIDGKYLGFIDQKFQMLHFTSLDNGGYVWYDLEKGNAVYFNNQWEIKDTLHMEDVSTYRETYSSGSSDDKYLIKSNDQILFTNYRNDTIFEINSVKKNPAIIFNLKKKLLPDDLQYENIRDNEIYENKASPYQRVNFMQTDSFLFILQRSWTDTKTPQQFYTYNRNTNDLKQYTHPFIQDDMVINTILPISFYANNKIISIIFNGQILKAYEKASSTGAKSHWPEHLLKEKEIYSPVIVILNTK